MAKVDIKMPNEFLGKLLRITREEDAIAERALNAGADIVYRRAKSNLASVIGNGTAYASRSTGELLSSLGVSSVRIDRNGNHNIKIGFSEPRTDGDSNAKIASVLEYGKHGQPPKPFMKPAQSSSRTECIEAIKRVLEEEMKR